MNYISDCFNQCFRSVEGYQSFGVNDVAVSGSTGNTPNYRSVKGFQRIDVRAVDVSEPTLAIDSSNFIRDYPSRNAFYDSISANSSFPRRF